MIYDNIYIYCSYSYAYSYIFLFNMNNRIQNMKKKRMDGLLKNGIPDLFLFAALVGFMEMQFGTVIIMDPKIPRSPVRCTAAWKMVQN